MTIETATYIHQLNASYPEGAADRSTADDHLRLIKSTVLATFPSVAGPVSVTHTELNLLAGASTTLASVSALTTQYSLSISAAVADIARISQTVSVVIARVVSISALNTQYSLSISAAVADIARISQTVSVVIARVATLSSTVATVQTDVARISTTVATLITNAVKKNATVALAAGYTATSTDAGTKSSGTFTPTVGDAVSNFQKAVNGGAHTLAPPVGDCTVVIQYTNNASAGAVTTSGWTKVSGSFTTTDGDDFMVYGTVVGTFSHLTIVALQ